MNKTFLWVLFLSLGLSFQLKGEISLPAIFADHMVLQRETTTKIWGKADASKRVTVVTSWNLKRYTTNSDANGNWQIDITTPRAGGPHTIVISDGKPMTLTNVMSGEVWLCSGQSNMEMPMKGFNSQPVEGSAMDILKSANNKIRLFTVRKNHSITPVDDVNGHWQEAMPISVRDFSATGYYFGRLLNEMLDIPVGLINSSWGGSRIETWMNEEMLADFPGTVISRETENVVRPHQKPLYCYNAMIHPLTGFAVRGVIWYQGESNRNDYHEYAELFGAMVKGWRAKFNNPNMPVYFCQIAPFEYKDGRNSAYLREAQLKATTIVENTGMAVLMDAGERVCIHPAKKKEAGERLALLALSKTYDMPGISGESPVYKSMKISNDTVTLTFDNAPVGVAAPDFQSKLFTVAGEDRIFYPARTRITGSRITVISDQVKEPKAVRYAFENYLIGDLTGADGLPVSSFRTDNW